jgi:hypothetical protein
MAFSDDGIKRPRRRAGQRQTRSVGTLTLFHATARCKSAVRGQDDQPSEFTGRLGSPTGLGSVLEEFCRQSDSFCRQCHNRSGHGRVSVPQFPPGYYGQLRPQRRPFFAAQARASWDSVGSPTEADWATGKVSVLGAV